MGVTRVVETTPDKASFSWHAPLAHMCMHACPSLCTLSGSLCRLLCHHRDAQLACRQLPSATRSMSARRMSWVDTNLWKRVACES